MKVLALTEENCLGISLIEMDLTDKGNLIIIAGPNGAGKTSALDGLEMLLNGAESIPAKPVRRGQAKCVLECTLGEIGLPELLVKRTITADGGGSLIVRNAELVKQESPQTILDKLKGKLTFDPLAYASMKDAERTAITRELLGLDFKEKDATKDTHFKARTDVNRDAKALEARLTALSPAVAGLPELEISSAEIIAQQAESAKVNQANANHRANAEGYRALVDRAQAAVTDAESALADTIAEIERLQVQAGKQKDAVEAKKGELSSAKVSCDNAADAVSKLVDVDLTQFNARAADVDKTNVSIRNNKTRADLTKQLTAKRLEADALTRKIDAIESQKREAIAAAKFPVAGMGLDDMGEVQLNGLPFEQANTRAKILASLAMGAALNPKLRVVLVRSGNDIDDAGMKIVGDWCEANNMQIWLERIRTDGNVTFIIEDGHIAGVEPVSIPQTSNEPEKMDMVKESGEKPVQVKTPPLNQNVQTGEKVNQPAKRGPRKPGPVTAAPAAETPPPPAQAQDDLIP